MRLHQSTTSRARRTEMPYVRPAELHAEPASLLSIAGQTTRYRPLTACAAYRVPVCGVNATQPSDGAAPAPAKLQLKDPATWAQLPTTARPSTSPAASTPRPPGQARLTTSHP